MHFHKAFKLLKLLAAQQMLGFAQPFGDVDPVLVLFKSVYNSSLSIVVEFKTTLLSSSIKSKKAMQLPYQLKQVNYNVPLVQSFCSGQQAQQWENILTY